MTGQVVVVLTTWPSAEAARAGGRLVVEERLAACANIVPAIESIYRWQGKVESSAEVLVIFKTTEALYAQLESRVRELHKYEVPEIIRLPVSGGLVSYLNWVVESCAE
jgi:periplasmic divalent cation tolerance protein